MAVPAIIAAAAPAVIQGLGGIAARLIAGKPKVPDLVAPAINEAQAALSDIRTAGQENLDLAEERFARIGSSGFSGAAGRQDIINANARQGAIVRGSVLDTLARARQQQEILEADAANARRQELISGITGGAGSAAEGLGGLLSPASTGSEASTATTVATTAASVPALSVGITPSQTPSLSQIATQPSLSVQADRAINPANQLVELDFRPGQSLTSFSQPRASLANTMGTFSNSFFATNQ